MCVFLFCSCIIWSFHITALSALLITIKKIQETVYTAMQNCHPSGWILRILQYSLPYEIPAVLQSSSPTHSTVPTALPCIMHIRTAPDYHENRQTTLLSQLHSEGFQRICAYGYMSVFYKRRNQSIQNQSKPYGNRILDSFYLLITR